MKKVKKIRKIQLNQPLRVALAAAACIIIAVMGYMIYNTKSHHKYIERKYTLYSYSSLAKMNYEVFLLPNQILSQKSLSEGNTYITSLVDHIETDFIYEYKSEKAGEVNGKYNITAVLEGYLEDEKGRKSLWKKEYELIPEKTFTGDGKTVLVKDKVPVNFKEYSIFAEAAAQAAGFNFSTSVTVIANIDTRIETSKKTVSEKLSPAITIPLNTKYFDIKSSPADEKKSTVEDTTKVIAPGYDTKIWIYGSMAAAFACELMFIILFTSRSTGKDPVDKKREKIFKDNGNRMAAVYNSFDNLNHSLIEVFSIDDLVRIADDAGRPILYNNSLHQTCINKFYVLDENNIYMLDITRNCSGSAAFAGNKESASA